MVNFEYRCRIGQWTESDATFTEFDLISPRVRTKCARGSDVPGVAAAGTIVPPRK